MVEKGEEKKNRRSPFLEKEGLEEMKWELVGGDGDG